MSQRYVFIDAARGAAMLFVLLSHFAWVYFYDGNHPGQQGALLFIGQVASPTFILLSGLMVSFIATMRPNSFPRLRQKLLDRSLFLLTIGHLIILVAYIPYAGGLSHALRYAQITDAIAVAIVVGPWLVTRATARQRLLLALVLYAGSAVVMFYWHPASPVIRFIKQTLVGESRPELAIWTYHFPIIPWLAVDLAGTALGGHVAGLLRRGGSASAARLLAGLGGAAVATGVLLRILAHLADQGGMPLAKALRAVFSLSQKLPPGPAYLLCFGGLGLLLVRWALLAENSGHAPRLLKWLSMLGRTSLFVFLLQELIYVGGLSLLHLPYTPLWPVYFLVSVAVIAGAAYIWNARGLMRWMTVGLSKRGVEPATGDVA